MQVGRRAALAGAAVVATLASSPAAGAGSAAKAPSLTIPVPAAGSVNFGRLVVKGAGAQAKLPKLRATRQGAASPVVVGSVRRKPGTKDAFVVAVTVLGEKARTAAAAAGAPKVTVTVQGASGPLTASGRPFLVADTLVFEEKPPAFCREDLPPGSVRDPASALLLLIGTEEDRRFVRDWHRLGLLGACDVPVDPAPVERIGALACKFTLTKTGTGTGKLEGTCNDDTSSVTFGDVLAAAFERVVSSGDTSCSVEEILERAHIFCAARTAAQGPLRVEFTWRGADPKRPWVAASGVPRPGAPASSIGPLSVRRVGF